MAEMMPLERSSAIALPVMPAPVAIAVVPVTSRFILRGGPVIAKRAGDAFGAAVPTKPRAAIEADGRVAMWLGPDEWLLLADSQDPAALTANLEAALRDEPHSLVNISHRQIGLTATGRGAPRLLSAGCPLDLSPDAFPVGMAARTVLAKAEIVLWRPSEDTFRLEVWRSFAEYVVALLSEAARGLPDF